MMNEIEAVAAAVLSSMREDATLFFASDTDPDPAEAVQLEPSIVERIAQVAIAALDKHRAEKGLTLAPAEPTYQMCVAGGFKWESPWEGGFPKAYRAMMAAANPAGPSA